jgi:hypothetical protein
MLFLNGKMLIVILLQTYTTSELESKLCDLEYKLSMKGK